MSNAIDEILRKVETLRKNYLFAQAIDTIQAGLRKESGDFRLLMAYGKLAFESRDFYTSALVFEDLAQKFPDQQGVLIEAAIAWSRLGDFDKSIGYCKEVLELSPSNQKALLSLGDILERSNQADEAEALLDATDLKLDDNGNYQRLRVRIAISNKRLEEAVDLCYEYLTNEQSALKQSKLFFLLCKANDKLGEYDKAWLAAEEAHRLGKLPFDEQKHFDSFATTKSFFSREVLPSLTQGEAQCVEPLFIVSNPRSGTSLLEQILSMHPAVANGGEMTTGTLLQSEVARLTDSFHQWPQNLIDLTPEDALSLSTAYAQQCDYYRGNARIVTNKALNLHSQLGFLSIILPNSKSVIIERNPLDNAVSCFTNNLLAAGLPYTNNIECIGKTWVERKKLATHWREVLSIPILELHYEQLVSNQRAEIMRLLDFLNLDWDERCMDFHKSTRVAKTISYDQVNKKMYQSSSGRWKNYEKHLGPLMDIVQSYI